jgi:hypothetical protein
MNTLKITRSMLAPNGTTQLGCEGQLLDTSKFNRFGEFDGNIETSVDLGPIFVVGGFMATGNIILRGFTYLTVTSGIVSHEGDEGIRSGGLLWALDGPIYAHKGNIVAEGQLGNIYCKGDIIAKGFVKAHYSIISHGQITCTEIKKAKVARGYDWQNDIAYDYISGEKLQFTSRVKADGWGRGAKNNGKNKKI